MGSGMRAEHWIVAAGVILAVSVIIASALPDSFWGKHNVSPIGAEPNSMSNSMADTQNAGVGVTGGTAVEMPAAGVQPENTIAGLVPFSRAKSERFRGKVIRIISLGNDTGWGQVHVWIDVGAGQAQEISIAPDWYLMHMGCTITEGAKVDGTTFVFGKPQNSSEYYAKTISVGGKTCNLRNDEGFALWSNRLR